MIKVEYLWLHALPGTANSSSRVFRGLLKKVEYTYMSDEFFEPDPTLLIYMIR